MKLLIIVDRHRIREQHLNPHLHKEIDNMLRSSEMYWKISMEVGITVDVVTIIRQQKSYLPVKK